MRKKTQSPLASANITAAWERVFEQAKVNDIEQLHSEGWQSVYDIAEQSGRCQITLCKALDKEVSARRFEKKLAKIKRGPQIKTVSFYRPLAK
jgi:hypothetical protein